MTKKDLIKKISTECDMYQKEVTTVFDKITECIIDSIRRGEEVSIPSFGKFVVTERSARECRNPRTGETFMSTSKKIPKFKPSVALKRIANNED